MVILGLALIAIIGIPATYVLGLRSGMFQTALMENKIAVSNLILNPTNMSPQLREYFKARIYSNIKAYYPSKSGYLRKEDWDFGPVDQSVLGPIVTFKERGTPDWETAIKDK